MYKKIVIVVALAGFASLTGCMSNQEKMDLNARLDALESKTNDALRTANTAEVDATTALHIAAENQSKIK